MELRNRDEAKYNATITGTVTDSSGAVILGASVTVTNMDTGARFTGESNEAGIYRVSALPVGTYSVEYQKNGFKKVVRSDLTLATAQVAQINVKMMPGAVTELVEVTTAPVMLDTETTDVGTVMTANSMKDLPLDINYSGVGRTIITFTFSDSGIGLTTGAPVLADRSGKTTLSFLHRTSVSTTPSSHFRPMRPRFRLPLSCMAISAPYLAAH